MEHCVVWIFVLAAVLAIWMMPCVQSMEESFRVEEYIKRYGNVWPPTYVPNTNGWKELMDNRFQQVQEIEERNERYEAWVQTVTQAFVAPNFTTYGFGLVRAPKQLTEALQEAIRGGLERGETRLEHDILAIEGPNSLFIDRPDLTERVVLELQPYVETWAGIQLIPEKAYGFRLYQNGAILNNHIDKPQTHIISMIYHIDNESDEPWPIFIEDFEGNTHEVILTPGDIMFYESSKCLHGRPKPFKGDWYSSVFVHYYPATGWIETDHAIESHYGVPPHWDQYVPPAERKSTPLRIRGTSFKEPSCPDSWCSTQHSIKWSGPFEDGYWTDAKQVRHPFEPKLVGQDEL